MKTIESEYIVYGALGIISLFGFIESGITFTPGFGIAILIVGIWQKYRKPKTDDLERQRFLWLKTIIEPILPQIRSNIRLLEHVMNSISDYPSTELGIQVIDHPSEHSLPDIVAAEREMTQLEERASLMLGSVVFIPVLFALMHLFRSVSLTTFLLEIFCALLLGLTVVESQTSTYKLDNWDLIVQFLETNREKLIQNPRQLLSETSPLGDLYRYQELGLEWEMNTSIPAQQFFHLISKIFIELLPESRMKFLEAILRETRELPQHQRVLEVKWNAYQTRVLLISVTATALSALFVSLAIFSLPRISTSDFTLESTSYLWWGQYLLVMSMNIMIWRQWYETSKVFRYGIYFTLIYILFYSVNSLLY